MVKKTARHRKKLANRDVSNRVALFYKVHITAFDSSKGQFHIHLESISLLSSRSHFLRYSPLTFSSVFLFLPLHHLIRLELPYYLLPIPQQFSVPLMSVPAAVTMKEVFISSCKRSSSH